MQWLNEFAEWFASTGARPVLFGAAVIVVAMIVSALLAAWIARGAVSRLVTQQDRAMRATAIATLVDAATEASVWNSLTPGEQVLADRAVGQADIQVRMLPLRGSAIAADWASHQLAEMKRTSATFGYQLEPIVHEFRDRLLEWQKKPSRARRVFQADLERWRAQVTESEKSLAAAQDSWVATQHHDAHLPTPAAQDAAANDTRPMQVGAHPDLITQRLLEDVEAMNVRRPVSDTDESVA